MESRVIKYINLLSRLFYTSHLNTTRSKYHHHATKTMDYPNRHDFTFFIRALEQYSKSLTSTMNQIDKDSGQKITDKIVLKDIRNNIEKVDQMYKTLLDGDINSRNNTYAENKKSMCAAFACYIECLDEIKKSFLTRIGKNAYVDFDETNKEIESCLDLQKRFCL